MHSLLADFSSTFYKTHNYIIGIFQITLSFYSFDAQMCSDCQSSSGNQCCRRSDDGIDPINRNAKLCNSVNESFKRLRI